MTEAAVRNRPVLTHGDSLVLEPMPFYVMPDVNELADA